MGSFNDRIFGEIRSDYIANGPQSFLYRYLSRENPGMDDKKLKLKAKDTMLYLGYPLSAARKLENAIHARDRFEQGRDDLRFSESSFDKDKNLARLEKRRDEEERLNRNLDQAREDLLENRGRKAKEKEKGIVRKNTALDLVEGWVLERGLGGTGAEGADLESCEKMYGLIRNDPKASKVWVPLRIDTETGAGLYIIGNDCYPDSNIENNATCQLTIFCPVRYDKKCAFSFWDGGYDDVRTAFEFMENTVCPESMMVITTENNELPDKAPEAFRKYFDRYDLEDVTSYTDEEYMETVNLFTKRTGITK